MKLLTKNRIKVVACLLCLLMLGVFLSSNLFGKVSAHAMTESEKSSKELSQIDPNGWSSLQLGLSQEEIDEINGSIEHDIWKQRELTPEVLIEKPEATIKYEGSSQSGTIKLAIMPATGSKSNGVSSIKTFEDINLTTIPSNSTWGIGTYTYLNETTLYRVSSQVSRNYTYTSGQRIDSPLLDGYLYIIDPTSTAPLVFGIDYDDDSAGNLQARITKFMTAGTPYLLIIATYNITTQAGGIDVRIT